MSLSRTKLPGVSKLSRSLRSGRSIHSSTGSKNNHDRYNGNRGNNKSKSLKSQNSKQRDPYNHGNKTYFNGNEVLEVSYKLNNDSDDSWEDVSFFELECDLKIENERLEAQVLRLSHELKAKEIEDIQNKENSVKITLLEKELEIIKTKLESSEKQIEGLIVEKLDISIATQQLTDQIQTLQSENEELVNEIHLKDESIQQLSIRLSEQMNAKLVVDESSLSNVSASNGSEDIADEYRVFTSTELMQFKGQLDEQFKEDEDDEQKFKLICDIIMVSERICRNLLKRITQKITTELKSPFAINEFESKQLLSDLRSEEHSLGQKMLKCPEETRVHFAITDYLRKMANFIETNTIYLAITKGMDLLYEKHHTRQPHLEMWSASDKEDERFDRFLDKVSIITWKMALQRPSMTFSTKGIQSTWLENEQEVFWKSEDPENMNSKVSCYVYPTLYHGDILMVIGKVCLRKSSVVFVKETEDVREENYINYLDFDQGESYA